MYPSINLTHRYLPGSVRSAANNLLCHGEVNSLPFGRRILHFKMCIVHRDYAVSIDNGDYGYPFGVLMPDCRLRGDIGPSPYFLGKYSEWSPLEISQLADSPYNQELLLKYRIFWMAESDPNQ
jgi:hypothetical protein